MHRALIIHESNGSPNVEANIEFVVSIHQDLQISGFRNFLVRRDEFKDVLSAEIILPF